MKPFSEGVKDLQNKIGYVPAGEIQTTSLTTCPVCNGIGWLTELRIENGHATTLIQDCPDPNCDARVKLIQHRYKNAVLSSEVPLLYQDCSFDSWSALPKSEQTGKELARLVCQLFAFRCGGHVSLHEAVSLKYPKRAVNYSNDYKNWIVLSGDNGMGKTGLVCAIVNALNAQNKPVLYTRLDDLINDIQARYGSSGQSAEDRLFTLQKAPLLIVDEFNIGQVTPDKQRIVESIIRYRHNHALATVITTNCDQNQFQQMWGIRTADVTFESAHWIPMTGEKIRKATKAIESF